jgi:hypothetical protein
MEVGMRRCSSFAWSLASLLLLPAPVLAQDGDAGRAHGLESESLFGFTSGSDTEEAGRTGTALETVGRFGKRAGRYRAVSHKLEFGHGVTDDLSVALGLFGAYHRIAGVPDLADASGLHVNGIGGELRWRLVDRAHNPFGMTLQLEPSLQLYDEMTGHRASKYGAENKLIFDTELVPDRLFAALNVLYEFERVRERGSPEWENGSKVGLAGALAVQVAPTAAVGAELRYLRAYAGLTPQDFQGEAVYVGPTLFWHFAPNGWLSAAWNVQVAGHEAGNAARLDLAHFERHQARLKIGFGF